MEAFQNLPVSHICIVSAILACVLADVAEFLYPVSTTRLPIRYKRAESLNFPISHIDNVIPLCHNVLVHQDCR